MPSVTPRINPKNRNVEGFDQLLRRFKKECDNAGIVQEVEIESIMRNLTILKIKRTNN